MQAARIHIHTRVEPVRVSCEADKCGWIQGVDSAEHARTEALRHYADQGHIDFEFHLVRKLTVKPPEPTEAKEDEP